MVTAADPWIARCIIVAAFEGNADEVSIEPGRPFEIRGAEEDQRESAPHARRLLLIRLIAHNSLIGALDA